MSSMIDHLRHRLDEYQDRLADHTRRIGHLEVEEERTRQRLHRIEGDREALAMLVETTKALADQTRTLAGQVSTGAEQTEALAESAAEKAVTKAFARRSASRWRFAGRIATQLVAVGSLGSLIAYLIIH